MSEILTSSGFQQTIELADGTSLNGFAYLHPYGEDLWIYLEEDTSMIDAFRIFSNSEKTSRIVSHIDTNETFTYEKFTELNTIQKMGQKINIRMKQERN